MDLESLIRPVKCFILAGTGLHLLGLRALNLASVNPGGDPIRSLNDIQEGKTTGRPRTPVPAWHVFQLCPQRAILRVCTALTSDLGRRTSLGRQLALVDVAGSLRGDGPPHWQRRGRLACRLRRHDADGCQRSHHRPVENGSRAPGHPVTGVDEAALEGTRLGYRRALPGP